MSGAPFVKEDVYETEDLPESDQHIKGDEKFESEHIDGRANDLNVAFEKFKNRQINAENVDFSDYLTRKRRKGYGANAYCLELIGLSAEDFDETPAQKYTRLVHEVNELQQQVAKFKTTTDGGARGDAQMPDTASMDDIIALQQQLKQLQVEEIVGTHTGAGAQIASSKIKSTVDTMKAAGSKKAAAGKSSAQGDMAKDTVTYELVTSGGTVDGASAKRLATAEARLARLEKLVGNEESLHALSAAVGGNGTSVRDTVAQLSARVQLLDAAYLDGVEGRLNHVLLKLNELNDKTSAAAGGTGENALQAKRINELYDAVQKYSELSGALPDLCARLIVLQQLHEQSVTQVDGAHQQLAKTLDTDAKLLAEVRAAMADNMERITKSLDATEKRVKSVAK